MTSEQRLSCRYLDGEKRTVDMYRQIFISLDDGQCMVIQNNLAWQLPVTMSHHTGAVTDAS